MQSSLIDGFVGVAQIVRRDGASSFQMEELYWMLLANWSHLRHRLATVKLTWYIFFLCTCSPTSIRTLYVFYPVSCIFWWKDIPNFNEKWSDRQCGQAPPYYLWITCIISSSSWWSPCRPAGEKGNLLLVTASHSPWRFWQRNKEISWMKRWVGLLNLHCGFYSWYFSSCPTKWAILNNTFPYAST